MHYNAFPAALRPKYLMIKTLMLSALLLSFTYLLTSCDLNETPCNEVETTTQVEGCQTSKHRAAHSYGGWSCPDNLRGFPAVDLSELNKVPVVNGRLPTKEETRTGTSLMFFDTTKILGARPLDMTMPRLVRYYSVYTKKNELVIVIQAVVVEQDTVVGFRYLNGGNGSAWFDEVNFITDAEIEKLGSTPFVSLNAEINASKETIWRIITSRTYASSLGAMFAKNGLINSDWKENSNVHFKHGPDGNIATGTITAFWENMYVQIDYNNDGNHYAQKFLLLENEDKKGTQLHLVSGPYDGNYETQKTAWTNWLQKVKELSEGM
jgi:hypothetical protein